MAATPADGDTDRLLALGAGAAEAGLRLYDRVADRIHDLVLFTTRDAPLAAAITMDVVVMAAGRATAGTAPSPLGAWLYEQARVEAGAVLAARGRPPVDDRVVPLPPLPAEPAVADLAAVAWAATAALGERDLALLDLHLRHGLDEADLAAAMGLSRSSVEVLLPGLLERVEVQVGAALVAAGGLGDLRGSAAGALVALAEAGGGASGPALRRLAAERTADVLAWVGEDPDRRSAAALLRGVPLAPPPASLREAVAARLRLTAPMSLGGMATGAVTGNTAPPEDTLPPGAVPAVASAGMTPLPPPTPGTGLSTTGGHRVVPGPAVTSATPGPPAGALPTGSAVVAGAASSPSAGRGRKVLAVALAVAAALAVAGAVFRAATGGSGGPGGGPVALADLPRIDGVTPGAGNASGDAAAAQAGTASTGPRVGAPAARAADGGPVATTTTSAAPGVLAVPVGPIRLDGASPAPLRLRNAGGTAVGFELVDLPGWVEAARSVGSVGPGQVVDVALRVAPDAAEGDRDGVVVVRWDGPAGGTAAAAVAAAVERAPDVGEASFGTRALLAAGCGLDRTPVEVAVADESAVVEVLVVATPEGGGDPVRTALEPADDGRWTGEVGPFAAAGRWLIEIRAVDARGNAGAAGAGALVVGPCPGG